jgi:PAS domain S-box-containing protein
LLELSPDAVAVVDPETEALLAVDRQLADMTGLSESELVGRDQTCLHPSEDEARYRELFRRHLRSGEVSTARFPDGDDLYVETAEGERVPVEIRGKTKRVDGRKVFVEILRDVSDRTAPERDLRRKVASLERLSQVLAHDLRTPLTVAANGVAEAKRTGDMAELEQVETAHARMEDILEDTMTLVREGYEVESVEALEFEALARSCWENVATADASLRVVTDGTLDADPKRVRNLFENLFTNSVEHGGEGVTVRAGVYKDGFFVADDGAGIPEDEWESVTEPGWTTTADGTGLGLHIVSEIARAHDWSLTVGDSQDAGARFDVTGVRTSVESNSDASKTTPGQ